MFHLSQKNVSLKALSMNFYLKPLKKSTDQNRLYLRIVYDRTKCEISTGISCKNTQWDSKKEQFKKSSVLNQRLGHLKERIHRAKLELDDSNKSYSAKDVKDLIIGKKDSKILLLDYTYDFVNRKIDQEAYSSSTIKLYKKTSEYLCDFLQYIDKPKMLLADFNLNTVSQFDDFLKQVRYNDLGERLSVTTINKYHTRLKTIINDAIQRGELQRNPYFNFRLSFPSTKREYLTKEELDSIKALELRTDEALDIVRDIFLFSCYTGLRFGDAMALRTENIIKINGSLHLRVDQIKTDERREIPLLNAAAAIVSKYALSSERLIRGRVLPSFTNQHVNRYFKSIATLSKINKRLTHHIARHTCATTILLDNDVPLEVVSHWLGHTSIKTTQIYAKISHSNLKNQSDMLNKLI